MRDPRESLVSSFPSMQPRSSSLPHLQATTTTLTPICRVCVTQFIEECILTATLAVITAQVLDAAVCDVTYTSTSRFGSYAFIPRFILAALMFVLALAQFTMQSLQAYRMTKQWLPNRYISLLVREGVLYFLAYVPQAFFFRPARVF